MKNILFILFAVFTISANAQQRNLYKLSKPIKSFDTSYQYIKWVMTDYPQSYNVYWCILKDTALNLCVTDGVFTLPNDVIQSWSSDDNVIPAYLEQIKVWANKQN